METNIHPPAGNLFVKTEQVAFHRDAAPVERRPCPHICHGLKKLPSHERFSSVHAKLRQQFLLRNQIERGKQDRAPAPRTRPNLSLERKRAPEQWNSLVNSTLRYCIPHGGARHHNSIDLDRGDRHHVESMLFSKLRQQPYVSGSAMSETKIRAHQNRHNMQP